MVYLLAVSLLWAFSFGLIGNRLSGVDPVFVAAARIALAAAVFLPFLRPSRLPAREVVALMLCGGVQFGLMYLAYLRAFAFVPSHLVALFSVFTPIYVVLFHDLGRRRFHPSYLVAALLAVAGAALIKAGGEFTGALWTGFFLMQAAGLAFAGGQILYRNWRLRHPEGRDREYMGWLYLGALVVAGSASLAVTDWGRLPDDPGQWAVLAYLGVAASGLGFFFWNMGATLARPATLAACNNAVIPLAMLVSLLLFREAAGMGPDQIVRLAAGTALIGAGVFAGERAGGTPLEGRPPARPLSRS